MKSAIVLKNLSKVYGYNKAVRNVNLTVHYGEVIALLGPNGAGKSTLINMIAGFVAPTNGNIFVDGENISENPLHAKEKIGFLPEGAPLYPDMSVKMFLCYMANLRGLHEKSVMDASELSKISHVLNQKIETLSKGYLRRVGFAQSILSNPKILLLDEPTDGLDPNQKDHIRNLISKMGKDKAILISTHLLEEAENVCNRIVLIDKGQIKADGSCAEIMKTAKVKSLEAAFRKLTITQPQAERKD